MKLVELTPYAKKKAKRRNISEEWIGETVLSAIQRVEGHGGREVAQRKYRIDDTEYLLRVIYEKERDTYVVITAYLTSQIQRYWEEHGHETGI